MVLKVEPFTFDDVNPDIPGLKLTAKRYTCPDFVSQPGSLTLLLTHGTGHHKEHWEPTLEELFALQASNSPSIAEAWSFDWQNHGEGAVVNKKVLENRPPGILSRDWARAIISFLKTGIVANKRLVAIGHSFGSTPWVLAAIELAPSEIPFELMILVEPPLLPREAYERSMREGSAVAARKAALRKAILARRQIWPSKQYAKEWFSKRLPWKIWDKRILDIVVEHGLQTLDSPGAPGTTSAILRCTREQEEASYGEPVEDSFLAYEYLPKISAARPLHFILSERDELMPRYTQDLMIRDSNPAGSVRIPKVGHMVVQEAPRALAEAIGNILKQHHLPVAKL